MNKNEHFCHKRASSLCRGQARAQIRRALLAIRTDSFGLMWRNSLHFCTSCKIQKFCAKNLHLHLTLVLLSFFSFSFFFLFLLFLPTGSARADYRREFIVNKLARLTDNKSAESITNERGVMLLLLVERNKLNERYLILLTI